MSTLEEFGEVACIRRLTSLLGSSDNVKVGIGDDAAVVGMDEDWDLVLTSDAVIEGVHFESDTDRRDVGHKAIGRVLSDLAAMGAIPLWGLIDVEAPASAQMSDLEALYEGVSRVAQQYGFAVVGGDMAAGSRLATHVFGAGKVPADQAMLRSGAQVGDAIYVTGSLGGSMMHGRHLTFNPRVREGQWLRETALVGAMIDVSDGLATDLSHIVSLSGKGAELNMSQIPVSDVLVSSCEAEEARERALTDGEDFELLFTVRGDKVKDFESAWTSVFKLACTRIGTITDQVGRITMRDETGASTALRVKGFEHFRK